ncbi:MAG: sigma-70 family RNA polymerase sigma factor [Fimbriiglobus sp.]|jgi:RNA polymerase sigma-70 factor (ECF subfamily)|nr:sigma-70 family RNA polymerase sigma factor [Fimbriiglobus sp.]
MSASQPKFDSAVHDVQNDADDDTAWVRLVYRYQEQITLWCRKLGLQLADAENVTQEVLVRLTRKIHLYDPKKAAFATWLRRVTIHVARNYVRKQTKAATGSGDTSQMMRLQEVQDDSEGYWEQLHAEADREMLAKALARTRSRVTPEAWRVFELAAIHKKPGAEVAEELGVSAQSVYSARHRVMQVLREQMQALADEAG